MKDQMDEKSSNGFEDEHLDQFFNEEKLDKAIKKGKRKSTKRTVIIAITAAVVAVVFLNIGNFALGVYTSNKGFERLDAYVRLTVPNGYISTSVDDIGFLGGMGDYTISRTVNGRPVVLENSVRTFGIVPQPIMTRSRGGGHMAGEWPRNYWEYGYNKMMFFHPEINYKEYKNDLEKLEQISEDKIIEVALSLDKPYTVSEISRVLPGTKISWYWVDTYGNEELERYATEAREYDAKSAFIYEYEALGVHSPGYGFSSFDYNEFLFDLKTYPQYQKVYDRLNSKGYTDPAKVPLLGVVVQGSKEELDSLVENPHIKASSFGVIIDKY